MSDQGSPLEPPDQGLGLVRTVREVEAMENLKGDEMESTPRSRRSSEEMQGDGPLYSIELEIDLVEGTTEEQALSLVDAIRKTTKEHGTHGTAHPTLVTYVRGETHLSLERQIYLMPGG